MAKIIRHKKVLGSYPNFTVIFSITMAMFVMGLFSIILSHTNKLSDLIKESIEVNVFLRNEQSDSTINAMQSYLISKNYILVKNNEPQVTFVDKETARKKFIENYGEDFSKVLEDNPLYAYYSIRLKPEYSDSIQLRRISDQIAQLPAVKEVYYQDALINKINKNIKTISFVLAAFALILIVASILLINNTIKLALYSQRFLIRSMQLVGATQWFIQRPFLNRALVQGLLGGFIAALALYGTLQLAYGYLPELRDLEDGWIVNIIYTTVTLTGSMIGFFSSSIAIRRYLNMSLDQLY